jgi:hypothetical protein
MLIIDPLVSLTPKAEKGFKKKIKIDPRQLFFELVFLTLL